MAHNVVQQPNAYSWVLRLAETSPSACQPLLDDSNDLYGFEFTWEWPNWPRKLIVRVEADPGNCVALQLSGRHWYRLWIQGDNITTNIKDLHRTDIGGDHVIDVTWPVFDDEIPPISGLAEAIGQTFDL